MLVDKLFGNKDVYISVWNVKLSTCVNIIVRRQNCANLIRHLQFCDEFCANDYIVCFFLVQQPHLIPPTNQSNGMLLATQKSSQIHSTNWSFVNFCWATRPKRTNTMSLKWAFIVWKTEWKRNKTKTAIVKMFSKMIAGRNIVDERIKTKSS